MLKGHNYVAIMQPTYLPYLGYFALIKRADHFVFLDDAQFGRDSFHQKNRILSNGPHENRLKIPVIKAPLKTALKDIAIDNQFGWQDQHLKALRDAYKHAPHFHEIFDWFEAYFQSHKSETSLSQWTSQLIIKSAQSLKITTVFHYASHWPSSLNRSLRLLEILSQLQTTDYLSPLGREIISCLIMSWRDTSSCIILIISP